MTRKRRRSATTTRKSNAAGLNALSLCFTRQLAPVAGDGGSGAGAANLIFSPVSIYAALALLAAGAHGRTLQELLDALGGESRDDLAAFARRVAERALADRSRSGGGPAVAFACGAWHDAAWTLLPGFRDAAAAAYNAEALAVDFSNEPENAVREINGRMAAATNKQIESILDPSSVNTLTSLVLTSAIYFKGRWEAPFAKAHTTVGKFHRLDGSAADVPFMCSVRSQYIAVRKGYKVLKLPYRSLAPALAPRKGSSSESKVDDNDLVPKYFMCIFLPDERDGLPGLVENIASGSGFWHYHLLTSPVPVGDFRLPKFKLSASSSVNQILRDGMGINSAFDAGEADLADMAAKDDDKKGAGGPLYVGDVCHKAVLEVNEGGTAAIGAAGSYMLCGASAVMDQQVMVDFVADQPFVFFVIEEVSRASSRKKLSGAIVFVGRVFDPSISE